MEGRQKREKGFKEGLTSVKCLLVFRPRGGRWWWWRRRGRALAAWYMQHPGGRHPTAAKPVHVPNQVLGSRPSPSLQRALARVEARPGRRLSRLPQDGGRAGAAAAGAVAAAALALVCHADRLACAAPGHWVEYVQGLDCICEVVAQAALLLRRYKCVGCMPEQETHAADTFQTK